MSWALVATLVQVAVAVLLGLYLWQVLRGQPGVRPPLLRDHRREMEKLERMRAIRLTEPLAERTRPRSFGEIVGQADALRALRAALCGPNPQHVLLYGPPGVGKTAAARLVLEEARGNGLSPFGPEARFVEMDATTARFDERGIADPLIGSVHDPIYQGAGALGAAGVPQPKPGAVTRAHGGILFLDEIGELHPIQMNKLLKVLEDRRVLLESAYYNPDDPNLPRHIKDIFENGLPADFRLVGATTRLPEELPPALRSRCVEIFFRALTPEEVATVARQALERVGIAFEEEAVAVIAKYATNGREAVNLVQIAAGVAQTEGRTAVRAADVEWVVASGQYAPRLERRIPASPQVGQVNGLALAGPNQGILLEIEATVQPAPRGRGSVVVTGVVEEEELGGLGHVRRRKSMARGAVDNVLAVLRRYLEDDLSRYLVHVNFPGGVPVDGPSAGVSVATAVYSAMTGIPVDNRVAMTGEVSLRGGVKPVGGVVAKVRAARLAGAERVLIPRENWQSLLAEEKGIVVVPVDTLEEVLKLSLTSEPPLPVGLAREGGALPALGRVPVMAREAPPA